MRRAKPWLLADRTWRSALLEARAWPLRRWVTVLLAGAVAALITGIPTGVVRSSLYQRMTPVTWWDYPIWAASALLIGLIAATYVRVSQPAPPPAGGGPTLSGSLLATFAIGCPICNKIVVALIGVSGALDYWAPLQPYLGLASVGLLAYTLALRMRGLVHCQLTAA